MKRTYEPLYVTKSYADIVIYKVLVESGLGTELPHSYFPQGRWRRRAGLCTASTPAR